MDPQLRAASPQQALFDQIVAAKGNPTGVKVVDPEIEEQGVDRYGEPTKTVKKPNPTPTYELTFADGTHLLARTGQSGQLELLGGTAQTSAATAQKPPTKVPGTILGGQTPNEQFIVTVNPDGTVTQSPNPNYQGPKPAVPKGPEITVPARRPGQTTDLTTVKNEADAYLANLNAQLAAGTIKAPEYGRLWDSYYQTTVKPKLDQANAEANAEAARLARRTTAREDRETSLGEAEFGQKAGRYAVADALALLPYQVSPTFLREFAAGLGTLSSGGGHVAFSPEAFQIQLPDLNALADAGAARAAAAYRGTAGVPFTPQGAVAGAAPQPMSVQQSLAAAPLQPRPMPGAMPPQIQAGSVGGEPSQEELARRLAAGYGP